MGNHTSLDLSIIPIEGDNSVIINSSNKSALTEKIKEIIETSEFKDIIDIISADKVYAMFSENIETLEGKSIGQVLGSIFNITPGSA